MVKGCCKQSNVTLGSTKDGLFLDYLSDSLLLKKGSAARN
jgi:hypothetical protein